ncbi:MerR family transcriptional regulator [Planomonospora sp. ID67723]|uniref:MerR family transcriptional regulator n=1 Tax=Planomonospora sp. ID67723 TaxID=2738134 RepID=UPI0018C3621A|nr:MerR family transcriptional regulator [Planomonospora sp. ID67723]MBG0831799.1 MerR family transcriptional regulator [Planomonospora sp. ID67723]
MLEGVNEEREDGGELLPIGRFARLCRLSVKQLRNYAELGLLAPAWVDPATGYRYYRAGQAREALSIGLLRSLDVPLAAIGEVLSGTASGSSQVRTLGRVRDELEAELARRRRTLATLERVLLHGIPASPVEVVAEPARRVALARDTAASAQDIGRAVSSCVARLLPAVHDGARPRGEDAVVESVAVRDGPGGQDTAPARLIGLFPVEPDEPLPVAVALDLAPAAAGTAADSALRNAGGELRPPPGTALDLLPGGAFARVTHVGPYDQITLAYHALLAWCAERGHPARGPVREVYLSDPVTTPPERLVTDLMIRLEDLS